MSVLGWKEGVLTADTGEVVASPQMAFGQLLGTATGKTAEIEKIAGTNCRNVVMKNVSIDGHECFITASFAENHLEKVLIELSQEAGDKIGLPPAPPFWPRPGEVAFLEEWVRQQTGKKPPAKFPWGQVTAAYDSKGGFASIGIRYAQ